MTDRAVSMRVGDTEVLVETSQVVPGTQQTSVAGEVAKRAVGAFEEAEAAIVEVARSLTGTGERLSQHARRPDRVEVEFGVKFSAQGNVVVASASGEATLRVLVSYKADQQG